MKQNGCETFDFENLYLFKNECEKTYLLTINN